MEKLQLSEIWIYPIKSLGGISLPTSRVLPKGLQYDRRWMLVDDHGIFITQRTYPHLAKFHPLIQDDKLIVKYNGESLSIPFTMPSTAPISVIIWDDTVVAHEVSAEHSRWFSKHTGLPCRLVFFPEENPREVESQYKINDDHTSLSDGYPFLLIGQSSLDDLNSRLPSPVPINRFRPNFVVIGAEPFEEDTWRDFSIGTNQFTVVKPSSRCIMTTVNHLTGEKDGAEPLATLARFRKQNNKIYFGQNVIARHAHQVSVGDIVTLP